MRVLRILGWATTVASLALANRADAQIMYGGSLRYGGGIRYAASPFGSVVSMRGPFGGRVTVAQGPFGGGAVGVRGPFGGRVGFVRPPVVPVFPVAPVVPVAPVTVVQQTVLNPAPAPLPYSAAYLARIPPGFSTLAVGGTNYYYTPFLPPGAQATTVGGTAYFVSNGISYRPYFLGMQTVYLVVEL
ncbi:MAG TPA: hypothetical protein VMG10_19585 [Gemmataceae bacterium]|nr:hypothetical protein [Gemmataceae bacterium]